jgi:hypothetical protein
MPTQKNLTTEEQEALESFPLCARKFCEFIDVCADLDRQALLGEVSVRLARLCEVGARLPWVNPSTDSMNTPSDSFSLHKEQSVSLEAKLREKIGRVNAYWEVFDPTQKEEPVSGSLSIDLTEIYFDLKEALQLQESGAARDDVYFDWRLGFRSHWSRHAVSALKVALLLSDIA